MKKRFFKTLMLVVVLSLAVNVFAAREICQPTSQQTESAACVAEACYFHGIAVITDGTNVVTLDIYDNASAASGTKLIPTWVITTSSTNKYAGFDAPQPIRCKNGIYVNITCSGTVKYIVYYSE